VKISLPPLDCDGGLVVAVSWLPDRPSAFTARERLEYLEGRDMALAHLLDLADGDLEIIEAVDHGLRGIGKAN
jgi:hypothetical protein